jgi:hypothetical protein
MPVMDAGNENVFMDVKTFTLLVRSSSIARNSTNTGSRMTHIVFCIDWEYKDSWSGYEPYGCSVIFPWNLVDDCFFPRIIEASMNQPIYSHKDAMKKCIDYDKDLTKENRSRHRRFVVLIVLKDLLKA